MRHLTATVPYRIQTVLTNNPVLKKVEGGTHFIDPTRNGCPPEDINEMRAQKLPFRCHSFELACANLNIEHRLTKAPPSTVEGPRHTWTNGQVERINRTIKEATVKRYYYEMPDQFRHHLTDFVTIYNLARHLKPLHSLTPYEFICKT